MKFYIPSRMLHMIQEEDFLWLGPTDFNIEKKRLEKKGKYSDGWIFEADEGFNTFFTIRTGLQLPTITDQEYTQLNLDGVAFLGKERTAKLIKAWEAFAGSLIDLI